MSIWLLYLLLAIPATGFCLAVWGLLFTLPRIKRDLDSRIIVHNPEA